MWEMLATFSWFVEKTQSVTQRKHNIQHGKDYISVNPCEILRYILIILNKKFHLKRIFFNIDN